RAEMRSRIPGGDVGGIHLEHVRRTARGSSSVLLEDTFGSAAVAEGLRADADVAGHRIHAEVCFAPGVGTDVKQRNARSRTRRFLNPDAVACGVEIAEMGAEGRSGVLVDLQHPFRRTGDADVE